MDAFTALADPTRRDILLLLAEKGQLPATEICRHFDMSAPAISQHLKVLRDAEIVSLEKRAQQRLYSFEMNLLSGIGIWLDAIHSRWNGRVQAEELALQEKKKKDKESAEASASGYKFTTMRRFNVKRTKVWEAWANEKYLAQWFGPKGFPITHSKLNFREGGTYHYGLRAFNGSTMWGRWTLKKIDKPGHLQFITSFSDETGTTITRHPMSPQWPEEILSNVHFVDKGDDVTEVVVEWQAINASEEEKSVFEFGAIGMHMTWSGIFNQLDEFLHKAK